MSKPDYDRARNAFEFNVQKMGISIYIANRVTRGRWHSGDYTFAVDLRMNDIPLWSGPYTMGIGHAINGQVPKPEVADVLYCLFLDASCYEAAGELHDFASEFGYATDEHSGRVAAQRAYSSCRKASRYLRQDFTEREYATLEQLVNLL